MNKHIICLITIIVILFAIVCGLGFGLYLSSKEADQLQLDLQFEKTMYNSTLQRTQEYKNEMLKYIDSVKCYQDSLYWSQRKCDSVQYCFYILEERHTTLLHTLASKKPQTRQLGLSNGGAGLRQSLDKRE